MNYVKTPGIEHSGARLELRYLPDTETTATVFTAEGYEMKFKRFATEVGQDVLRLVQVEPPLPGLNPRRRIVTVENNVIKKRFPLVLQAQPTLFRRALRETFTTESIMAPIAPATTSEAETL